MTPILVVLAIFGTLLGIMIGITHWHISRTLRRAGATIAQSAPSRDLDIRPMLTEVQPRLITKTRVIVLMLILFCGIIFASFWQTAGQYRVGYGVDDTLGSLNPEEVAFMQQSGEQFTPTQTDLGTSVIIVNESRTPNRAAEAAVALRTAGLPVSALEIDTSATRTGTVIVFPATELVTAEAISEALGGVALSSSNTTNVITIFVGAQ